MVMRIRFAIIGIMVGLTGCAQAPPAEAPIANVEPGAAENPTAEHAATPEWNTASTTDQKITTKTAPAPPPILHADPLPSPIKHADSSPDSLPAPSTRYTRAERSKPLNVTRPKDECRRLIKRTCSGGCVWTRGYTVGGHRVRGFCSSA